MNRLARLVLLLTASALGAQDWDAASSLPVPPTAAARQAEWSQGVLAKLPVERLKAQTATVEGVRATVTLVRAGSGDAQLWELRWEPGEAWGAGTWVAFRDGLGQLREARVILLEGTDAADNKLKQPGTWIRLVPQGAGKGCRLDVFLAGRLITGGWTVPASLVEIMGSDDDWLWSSTAADIDWASLLPARRWEDEKVESLRTRLHKLLSAVPAQPVTLWWPDPRGGANGTASNGSPWGSWMLVPGEEGEAKRGLGPWGVTLWTAQGVLRGWKAPYPTWDTLLEPRVELPGYSRALVPDHLTADPAFALDWIRSLGLEAYRALYPTRPRSNDVADVRGLPFLTAVPAAGYAADEAPALLHLLAVTRPGQIYLASLSTQLVEQGKSSAVTFREPAVLLPWIGPDQRVRVAVYAGPKELTWDEWVASVGRAPQKGGRPDHVALVALPLPTNVELPLLPAR